MNDIDQQSMREAVHVAASAQLTCRPNPWVGAVLVAVDGRRFSGFTQPVGQAHAEVQALHAAGDAARGATMYVTLEPCNHVGRTPPCTDALIAAGVSRVVVGVQDPDTRVAGAGLERLREAGLQVDVNVCANEVSEQLAAYLHHRRTGRPFVVLKLAMTIDGFIAAKSGAGGWITGDVARRRVHELRAASDAILVGAGTVRADDPQLTVRDSPGNSPRRIVLGRAPTGARVHPCTEWTGPLVDLLDTLGNEGVLQLMVEGGANVAAQFHAAGLIDRYVFHIAPAVMGGADAVPAFAGDTAATLGDVWRGSLVSTQQLGDDVEVVIAPERSKR
ncbi:MAG: bifunctional diaminohydroxyphosphoribosylaminopyrimidine deaminase/5-amino-6-(5-phosphoribosylamino)uracil reductase RibD [Ilumatobacteraceae bacterium]